MKSLIAIKRAVLLTLLLLWAPLLSAQPLPSDIQSLMPWIDGMFRVHRTSEFLPEFEDSYGVVFRDLNNDGLADLYVVRFRNLNRLFINQGAGKEFNDMTIETGLGGNLMPRGKQNLELGASAADVDNNGLPDILIAGWGVASSIFFQNRNLQFDPQLLSATLDSPLDANAGVWADINRNGKLDLFLTDEHRHNHLLLNQGYGKFQAVTVLYGIDTVRSTSQGAAFADLDGDSFPDLYVCNWFATDVLYKNIQGRYFRKMQLPLQHLVDSLNSNSVSFGDIDNDGDLDFIVTDRDGQSRLYRNDIVSGDAPWRFTDITAQAGLNNPFPGYGSIIADLNNDGWQDIFFTNIGPNQFYLNQGNGKFAQAYQEAFPFISMKKKYSTGAAVADYDNDGDLDLFVANKDTNSIFYPNPLDNENYIRIHLRGVSSNWDAIGTKVWLYEQVKKDSTILSGYRELSGGSGYLSFSEPVAHFGAHPGVLYQIKIEFPSGERIVRNNLRAGSGYHIEEVSGLRKAVILTYRWAAFTAAAEDFWINLALFLVMVGLVSGFIYFSIFRYGWKNKQTAYFLISLLVIFYLLFIIQPAARFLTIILSQLGALFILMTAATAFMEKIRRLEIKRYGARKLIEEFSKKLIFIKDNKELYEQLARTIHTAMKTTFCAVMGFRNSSLHREAVSGSPPGRPVEVKVTSELKQSLLSHPIFAGNTLKDLSPEFATAGIHLAIPLTRNMELYAVVLLGKPGAHREYLTEDLSMLQILANQAAIAIENNFYIEEAKELTKKVTAAEVQKKYVRELEEKNRTLQELYRTLQETQSQLIQSEKMASLGQLVAGIAHELNNPISFIYANMRELENYIGAIEEILKMLPQSASQPDTQQQLQERIKQLQKEYDLEFIRKDIHALIAESIEGGHRVKEVVQNLRNFSRLDEGEIKSVDLHEGLESTLLLLSNEIKNRIEVIKDYGDLPKVECQPGHINQVFMNLLLNAIQAIEGQGKIWIGTRHLGDQVEITIKDSGKGIPENIQSKIFDPFFTTKPVGKGTGLGLSISYNIIKNHSGEITVESKTGEGTVFRIRLPVRGQSKQ